jgi:hypothetical protein
MGKIEGNSSGVNIFILLIERASKAVFLVVSDPSMNEL